MKPGKAQGRLEGIGQAWLTRAATGWVQNADTTSLSGAAAHEKRDGYARHRDGDGAV